jgi:hypothetical protein
VSLPGRPLEQALARAAAHYRALGRQVFVDKQEVRRTYSGVHAKRADIDLTGGVDGRALALEAKMTAGDSFALEPARAPQRAALSQRLADGADVALVVEFTDHGEIFVADWYTVQTFLVAAWRRSLTIDWFRAVGSLVPQMHANDQRRRCALWLDAAAHPDRAGAAARVEAERAGKPRFPIDGDDARDDARDRRRTPRQLELAARHAQRPSPSDREAYQAYMLGLVDDGIQRQLGAAGRPRPGARAGRWRGGRR